MRSINPTTGELISETPQHDQAAIDARINAALTAFPDWRDRSFVERGQCFETLAGLLNERRDDYAALMTEEMGKPIVQARSEVEKCAWVCEYFAAHAAVFLEPHSIDTDATSSRVVYEPLGPILAIMPWNFPFWQVFRFAAPTLMAGNVALLKHAPNVPKCSAAITALFDEAGFPVGVFNDLFIDVEATGELIGRDAIRGVSLTGSVKAGRAVAAAAGEAIKPCVLELGGSDPFVVLRDCDLDWTIQRGTYARMMNNGQSCIAAKRFIVEDELYEEFLDRFTASIEALTVGDPDDDDTDIGPLARADLRDNLHRQVTESIDAGATCLVGGSPVEGDGFFYEPTLLSDVTPGMAAFDEETFGPVAAVIRADDVDHAIEMANRTRFGLGASIWTDAERGKELARRFKAGSVFVNELVKSDPRLPFGGIKDSGLGRELSADGIREFVNVKTVYVR